jgi:hypothetical protein
MKIRYGKKPAMVPSESILRSVGAQAGKRQITARNSPKQMVTTALPINQ